MMETVEFVRDGLMVRGYLVLPEKGSAPYPLAIISHGFGANGRRTLAMAERLAEQGIAACAYSYCGAWDGDSDGSPLERSVLTEAADLRAVFDGLAARTDIDASHIGLFGVSEGGCVSTLVAAERPEAVRAMVLMYPALCIPDDARARVDAHGGVAPETMDVMGRTIGRIYLEDAMRADPFAGMPRYEGPVLIVHGTADAIVPIGYSRCAAATFPHAELIEIEGAGHGMRHEKGPEMARPAIEFIVRQLLQVGEGAEESMRSQAKEMWGGTEAWREYEKRAAGRSVEEERGMGEELMVLFAPFAKMATDGVDPAAPEAQEAARRIQAYITEHFYPCTDEIFAGLGRTYGAGGDFTRNINKVAGSGAAEFASRVIAGL